MSKRDRIKSRTTGAVATAKRVQVLDKLRTFNDPVLSKVCKKVRPGDDLSFLATMRAVCLATHTGVGLAAPQIGVLLCAAYINPKRNRWKGYFMLNPRIAVSSRGTAWANEGCLSYPDVVAAVERSVNIVVAFEDEQFVSKSLSLTGFEARIVQHELDHLSGICRVGDAWRTQKARQA